MRQRFLGFSPGAKLSMSWARSVMTAALLSVTVFVVMARHVERRGASTSGYASEPIVAREAGRRHASGGAARGAPRVHVGLAAGAAAGAAHRPRQAVFEPEGDRIR